jgi:hypothetical protein
MKKALAMVNQFPDVEETCKEIDAMFTHAREREAFLKQQIKNLSLQLGKDTKPLWQKLEGQLAAKGCTVDYNPKRDAIWFSMEEGVIYCEKDGRSNEGSSLQDVIKGLFT